MDRLFNEICVLNILHISKNYYYQSLDRGLLEYVGPTIISSELERVVLYKKYPPAIL